MNEAQRLPNRHAALSTYKVEDKTLKTFYDDYCHKRRLKNKRNEETDTQRYLNNCGSNIIPFVGGKRIIMWWVRNALS